MEIADPHPYALDRSKVLLLLALVCSYFDQCAYLWSFYIHFMDTTILLSEH